VRRREGGGGRCGQGAHGDGESERDLDEAADRGRGGAPGHRRQDAAQLPRQVGADAGSDGDDEPARQPPGEQCEQGQHGRQRIGRGTGVAQRAPRGRRTGRGSSEQRHGARQLMGEEPQSAVHRGSS
jgi:hypothetical protein